MALPEGFGKPALPWEPLPYMQEYLMELESQDKSDSHIANAKLALTHLARWCKDNNVLHPEEITRQHLLRFQSWCHEQPWSRSYQQLHQRQIRAWINWLANMWYIQSNPWHLIVIGRVEKRPNPLEDDELAQLFSTHRQAAFQIPPFAYHRRETILTLLYGWGLRVHELSALNLSNMDLRLDFVTVRNKGGNSKQLPYSQSVKTVVQRWMSVRNRHARVGEDALLITEAGDRLTMHRIRGIITDLGQRAGVTINPHRLRDTYGTHLLDSDVEVERVMKLLGHTNVKQTLAYARVNDRKVAESHARAMNPRLDALLNP